MKRNIVYILLLIPIIAWAASATMINPGNWNVSGNWVGGVIGGDGINDDVIISENLDYIIVQSIDNYTIGTLDMSVGNMLTIDPGGSLNIGTMALNGSLDATNNTTLNINGNLEIWGDLIVMNNLTLNVTGILIVHGDIGFDNDAIIDIQGSVTVDGDFIGKDNNNVNVDGVLNITGNLSMDFSGVLTGNGTINLTGGCTSPNSFCSTGPLDVTDPVISNCPIDFSVSLTGADCDEVVNWTVPTASDNVSVASFTSTHNSGNTFPVGITTVTYTATDVAGNMATCSFQVTVNDNTPPIISNCPADIVASVTGGTCDEIVNWVAPTAADNCSVASFNSTHNSGDTFPVGTTVVSYIATDPTGNVAICTFNVTVNDDTGPVITSCPADIVVSLTGGACDEIVNWIVPTAADNCSVASFTSTHNTGDTFPEGITTVTYTATDDAGNVAICSFKVTVTNNIPPVISNCPADIVVSLTGGDCDEIVNWIVPTASDNCGVASFNGTHNSGDTFPVGTTVVSYIATDPTGNVATCTFNVTVNDDTGPVISSCPADVIVNISGSGCDKVVTWIAPTAADNCSVDSFTSTFNSGDVFPLGVTTVTYTATDPSGNSALCSFSITVTEGILPVISSCPADVIVNISGSGCDEVVTWIEPTAADNCSVDSFTSTFNSGDVFPLGLTTVTYTATDLAGNVATCSFSVIVSDITPQVFDFCPTTVDVAEFDVSTQTAVVTWQEPTATDNCVIPGISSDYNTGDSFPAGRTIVTYTATYGSGSVATCEFSVDVIGNKLPVASPMSINTYAGEPLEICLKVVDPDGDNMVITAVDYDNVNGTIEPLKSDGSLCFIYTSFNDFEGDELLYVTVCDNGVPSACIETEVQVSVAFDLRLTFYKAFTPNNDNINDVWVIENIGNHPNNQVTIFDRLGGVVYSVKGYNNLDIVWDGRSNQNSQDITPTGTYFYKIDLENDESTLKGYVELIR